MIADSMSGSDQAGHPAASASSTTSTVTVTTVTSSTMPPTSAGPDPPAAPSAVPMVPPVPGTEATDTKKSPLPRQRSRSNQRWMKLRTTVQLSGAVASAAKEKKPPLKREDSFLKRFSTRQIAEAQETLDGDGEGDAGGEAGGPRRRKKRKREEPITVINPDENFYFCWLSVLTFCVLYNLWTLIVRQAFPELQRDVQEMWFCCDGFSDLVFLLDIVVQFRTGYLEQGLMVYDSRKLALHYVHSRAFVLDLASLVPLDLIQLKTGKMMPMIRFPRFLKGYRSYNYYYIVESRTLYPNLWRVVNLIHILLLLAHWFGCFYYLLSEAEGFRGEWAYPQRREEYKTLTRKYLGSFYWSTLTLTTIGDLPTPDTDLEYIFTIVSYLIGVFIFATIVGQVGNVITNRNASRLEFERLLDGAKLYMRQHKVPREMQRRVQRWYDYSWSRGRMQGGGDINSALGILPDKLKTELALHVNLNTLKKVSIFQECQPEFLHDLVLKMKAYIFTPGDLICRKGEVAREMFIIADGILEVINEMGKVLTTMKAGDFFGEIGILNLDGLNKRTADVRSVGYAELFSLSREDVLAAMKDYPEAQEILQNLGRKRLMEAKMAAAGLKKEQDDSDSRKGSSSGGKDSASGDGDSARSKAVQMVRKLKRDARDLRNYLRRGSKNASVRKKPDDQKIEMEPLTGSSEQGPEGESSQAAPSDIKPADTSIRRIFRRTFSEDDAKEPAVATSRLARQGSFIGARTRGILMRMQRVNSQAEPPVPSSPSPKKKVTLIEPVALEPPEQPLGAGLPLLKRLRMLKDREENAEKERKLRDQTSTTSTSATSEAEEPLGAGLPLLKRFKMLRDKEEKEKKEQEEKTKTDGGKKSRPDTTSSEASKTKPLPLTTTAIVAVPGGSGGKPGTSSSSTCSSPTTEPIGAGLPLLQRLRLLREKEDREKAEAESANKLSVPALTKAALLKKLETLKEEEKSLGESMDRSRSFIEDDTGDGVFKAEAMLQQINTEQVVAQNGTGSIISAITTKPFPIAPHKETILSPPPMFIPPKLSVTAVLHAPLPSPTKPTSPAVVPKPTETTLTPPPSSSTVSASDCQPEPSPSVVKKPSGWKILKAGISSKSEATQTALISDISKLQEEKKQPQEVIKSTSEEKEAPKITQPIGPVISKSVNEERQIQQKEVPSIISESSLPAPLSGLLEGNHPKAVLDTAPPHVDFKPEEYLADLLLGVKQVLQARLEEIQDQFKVRLVALEAEVRRKDIIIQRLEEMLHNVESLPATTRSPPPPRIPSVAPGLAPGDPIAEDVDREEVDNFFMRSVSIESMIEPSEREVGTDCPDDEFEEANDLTHPGYVSHPRRSWPLLPPWTVRRRRGGASHRAWESQAALDVHLDPEQLWRVEFPARSAAERPVHWQERRDDDDQDDDDDAMITDGEQEEEEGGNSNARRISQRQRINDWEIRLLAAQMAEKGDGGTSTEEEHDRRCLPIRVDEEDEEEDEDIIEEEEPKEKFKVTHSELRSSDSDLCQKTEQESSRRLSLREQQTETEDSTRLFGMLQQLSPTERRELERVLEVAAQRHLSQQMTFHSEGKDEDDESVLRPSPRRHHSLQGTLPISSPAISPPLTTESSTFLRRRGQNSRAARHSVSSPTQSSPLRVTDCGSELSSSLLASAVTTVASRLTETMPSPSHPPLLPPPPPRPPTPPSAYLRIPLGEDPDDSDQDVAGEQAADSDAGHRRPQSERCFFEDELRGESGEQCRVSPLLSPAGTVDDDTVSICIPECEPLLGPK